jgi:hypothetical protein
VGERQWCYRCAGYDPKYGFFRKAREDWIREEANFTSETPLPYLADWCDEHGRTADANYLRSLGVKKCDNLA